MVNNENRSFEDRVWQTLAAINVNDHIKKKGNLSYLSWPFAWQVLMEEFPASTYEFSDTQMLRDESVMVTCTVTVAEGDSSTRRTMWLPVMDHKNNAIKNPDARQISDTMIRCMVKAIAMHGLGHYIYAGEDIPQAEKDAEKEAEEKAFLARLDDIQVAVDAATTDAQLIAIWKRLDQREQGHTRELFHRKRAAIEEAAA